MKNHPDTVELLQKIDKLLTAVESLHNCLQTLEAVPNDSYDIARTQLRNAAREASHVIERHRSTQELKQKSEQNVPHSLALLASAEAAEWRANELRKNGDYAEARQASERAITLRQAASEAAVIERRQGMHLVQPIG